MAKNTSTIPETKTESSLDTTPAVSTTWLPLQPDEGYERKLLDILNHDLVGMSIEEAGEEILKGEVFFPCLYCDGKGGWRIHDQTDVCRHCSGMGNIYNRKYTYACRVLGLELPMLPDSKFMREEMARWNMMNVAADADQKYFQNLKRQERLQRGPSDFEKMLDRSRSILKRQ